MRDNRQSTGEWGERQAERYLRRSEGMRTLDRRWRHGRGELDLIMRKGSVLVFVEVRVRTGDGYELATYQSISKGKWRVLRRTAIAYIRRAPWHPDAVRFDVIGIRRKVGGGLIDINHWENVGIFGGNFRF